MKPYTIECTYSGPPKLYAVLNPHGNVLCYGATWRTARNIAAALNAHRDKR